MNIKNFSTKWIYLCPGKPKKDVISCDKIIQASQQAFVHLICDYRSYQQLIYKL